MGTIEKKGIMEASAKELQKTILNHLSIFDELQQDGPDEEDTDYSNQTFVKAYHETEKYYFKLKEIGHLSADERNSLRMTIKHYYKLIPENYFQTN